MTGYRLVKPIENGFIEGFSGLWGITRPLIGVYYNVF